MNMQPKPTAAPCDDPHGLTRFVQAQNDIYQQVLRELQAGRKKSHWMWFIFPQIDGLGHSETARHYAIKSAAEARAYLAHPFLGSRLRECCAALLTLNGRSASAIFGHPDDKKLLSSMTLFAAVADNGAIFSNILDRYYQGQRDYKTLKILSEKS